MRTVIVALAAVLLFGCPARGADPTAEFFNGKDLSGWEGLVDQYWSVKDGAIHGSAPKGLKFNTFLCSKQKYKDFELTFTFKMTKGANSGIQIRSKIYEPLAKTFGVAGPQCDIGQGYWGSLYGEHYHQEKGYGPGGLMKGAPGDVVQKVVKEGDWNDYYIKCVGNHVTIKLNGATTVDDDFKLPEEGIIAWQLHSGGPMEITFKDIRFTNLSAKRK